MLNKSKNNNIKYLAIFAFIILSGISFYLREKVLTLFLYYVKKDEEAVMTFSEREELEILRTENKIIKDEISKLRDEVLMSEDGTEPALIKLLMQKSDLYGTFFTTYPKERSVYVGMNVFVGGNIVVGQVEEIIGDKYLKVSRLGNKNTFIASGLENEESVELSAVDAGFYVASISGSSKFSVGDTIVLKGYPKAVVGNIVEVVKDVNQLSFIYVRAPFNLDKKEVFYVLQ